MGGDDHELMADGYFQIINNSINEVSLLLDYVNETKRLNRNELIKKLNDLYNALENY